MIDDGAATGSVDLHVHTDASDGLLSPTDVVLKAADAGLDAIAITDHDTVGGVQEAIDAGRSAGVEVIPGVELTSYAGGTELHLVGLFVRHMDERAVAKIEALREARRVRMLEMIRRLDAVGVKVDPDEVLAVVSGGAAGRPHLAQALVKRGYAVDEQEAFVQYLRPNRPGYVRKREMSPEEAIRLVLDIGGLPVYAHPGVSRLDERLAEFKDAGLAGIEVWHPKHNGADVQHYMRLALKRGLLPSGGSDFHGAGRTESTLGVPTVEARVLDELKNRHRRISDLVDRGA